MHNQILVYQLSVLTKAVDYVLTKAIDYILDQEFLVSVVSAVLKMHTHKNGKKLF